MLPRVPPWHLRKAVASMWIGLTALLATGFERLAVDAAALLATDPRICQINEKNTTQTSLSPSSAADD